MEVDTVVAKVTVKRAAEILGISALSVQCGIREKALPIGCAWHNEGASVWKYHISPALLSQYTGLPVDVILSEEQRKKNKK